MMRNSQMYHDHANILTVVSFVFFLLCLLLNTSQNVLLVVGFFVKDYR